VIEAADGVAVGDGFGQLGLAASENADDVATPLLPPADHLFVGDDRPILTRFTIERMILCPFLWILLELLVRRGALALVPAMIHRGKVAVAPPASLHVRRVRGGQRHHDLRPADDFDLAGIEAL